MDNKLIQRIRQVSSTTPIEECLVIENLIHFVPNKGIIVELGTGGGRVTAVLAQRCLTDEAKLFSVDSHEQAEHYGWDRASARALIDELGLAQYVTLIEGKTSEVAKMFSLPIDLLYIDASHQYPEVKEDVELWYPKVKVGGVISGHDFDPNCSDGRQVMKAVFDTLLKDPFIEFHANGRIWWHIKTEKEKV